MMAEQRAEEAREREIALYMETHGFSRADAEWCVRLGEARRRVVQLPLEKRERGAQLNRRFYALLDACEELRGGQRILTENRRQDTLEILEDLRYEIEEEFQRFREEHGIPDVSPAND